MTQSSRADYEESLLVTLREKFSKSDVFNLFHGFSALQLLDTPEVVSSAIEYALISPEIQKHLIQEYLNRPRKELV